MAPQYERTEPETKMSMSIYCLLVVNKLVAQTFSASYKLQIM
jgi:hypothetical protein